MLCYLGRVTMQTQVVFLSRSLDLSGSTTWINTLIRAFQAKNIICSHLIIGRDKEIQSAAHTYAITQQSRKHLKFKVMRTLQLHKIFKQFYLKQEDQFYSQKAYTFLNHNLSPKVLVIKDFTATLPSYFINDQFIVVSVLHHQYACFVKGNYHTHLITVSQAVMEQSKALGFDVEKVIYNPIETDKIKLKSNEYTVREDDYIIYVGRLHEEKGVYQLLEAYKELVSNNKLNSKLLFIGEGKAQESLEQLVKNYQLESKVIFKGFLNNPYPYIANARLLVLPSLSEAMGYVAIEAAILGTNYLVSDYPASSEFFPEENVFLKGKTTAEFIENLQQKILHKLELPNSQLKDKVLEKMSPDVIVEQYMQFLKQGKSSYD